MCVLCILGTVVQSCFSGALVTFVLWIMVAMQVCFRPANLKLRHNERYFRKWWLILGGFWLCMHLGALCIDLVHIPREDWGLAIHIFIYDLLGIHDYSVSPNPDVVQFESIDELDNVFQKALEDVE